MLTDWLLTSAHHLAVFSLAAILAAEIALTAGPLEKPTLLRLARVDAWFGIMAAAALAAGLARLFLGAKGVDYYLVNLFFWIKMALFALVGVVSILPTFAFLVWRRKARADAAFRPPAPEVARVRRAMAAEATLFAFIPVCAAAMARGFGM